MKTFKIWEKCCVLFVLLGGILLAANPRAVIIFDASGSMWGQIEGTPKITIAKEALKKVVRDWNPSTELGLTVYGHRTKGDCNDIETVVPVGKVDPARLISQVEAIQPKGKTPISRTLRKVANQLRQSEEASTIILISDGKESCDADPCATAKALKAEGIHVVAHVIGFHVDAQTDAQLSCIAEATGGEYFSAQNASDLNDATGKISKKVETPKPKPKPKMLKENLSVTTYLPQKNPISSNDITVYQSSIDEFGKKELKKITFKPFTSHAVFTLPEGNYTVRSHEGNVVAEANVTLLPGEKKQLDLIYRGGVLHVTAYQSNGEKYSSDKISVNKAVTDEFGKKTVEKVAFVPFTDTATFYLPPGEYILKAHKGKIHTQKKITLRNGERLDTKLVYEGAGKLRVYATLSEGGKPIGSKSITVYKESKDEFGKSSLEKVTWKPYPSTVTFDLPAGEYVVEAGAGSAWAKVPVKVASGKGVEVPVVLHAGKLRIITVIKGKNVSPESVTVSKEIMDSFGKPALEKFTWVPYPRGTANFILPEGEYVVQAISRDRSAKGKQKVKVEAGRGVEVELVLQEKGE